MAKESRTTGAREFWRGLVVEQERSGKPVRAFCRERGVGEHSFYLWRRRLGETVLSEPVRFALVERRGEPEGSAGGDTGGDQAIELTLVTGERLRIPAGVEAATLRTVLTAVRADRP